MSGLSGESRLLTALPRAPILDNECGHYVISCGWHRFPGDVPAASLDRSEVDGSVNSSLAPDPNPRQGGVRPEITSVDVDPSALVHPGLSRVERVVAAFSYVSIFPVVIALSSPNSRFVNRHLRVALPLFAVRVLWTLAVVGVWWWRSSEALALEERLRPAAVDLIVTLVIGAPVGDIWFSGALPWLLTPVIFGLTTTAMGFAIAVSGHSADIDAFLHANWTEPISRRRFLRQSPEEEKEQARRARERQIERLQKSSQMLRTEQARRIQIADIEAQLERIELQREYHDQLLALGEISQRRYDQVNAELDEQAAELRALLSSLETRVQNAGVAIAGQGVNRLRRPSETLVESLAIVTPDGVPIFTYGQFQLDDAIVAGMLSAFDSLSEEVFGSRVHKTALAEGQVLYFAHGDYVLIMAAFIDEPSPRQIEDLRSMLKNFEAANLGPIARKQYDPRYLHEVPIPFRFAERAAR